MASCGRTWLRNSRVCPSVPGDGFVWADVVAKPSSLPFSSRRWLRVGERGIALNKLLRHSSAMASCGRTWCSSGCADLDLPVSIPTQHTHKPHGNNTPDLVTPAPTTLLRLSTLGSI